MHLRRDTRAAYAMLCTPIVHAQEVDEYAAVRAVQEAYCRGINLFDTSPFYGATKSEAVLGRALQRLPRGEIVVCTKVGRYGESDFDFSAETVTARFHESLARLRLDYVDVVHCHDVEFGDLDKVANEALPALHELKAAGYVRHIGITGLPLQTLQNLLSRVPEAHAPSLVLSYCHFCLNDTSLLDHLAHFEARGLGIINASCFAMGLLTRKGPPEWHPAPEELRAAARRAAEVADSHGVDIARLALTYAVQEARIPTTLVGMATEDEVHQNADAALRAVGMAPNLAADKERAALAAVLETLQPVHNLSWPSGLPENS